MGMQGRILVFMVKDFKLQLVSEREVKGAVYNVNPFQVTYIFPPQPACLSSYSPLQRDCPVQVSMWKDWTVTPFCYAAGTVALMIPLPCRGSS